jgi:DNA-binding response OmpR family regulator
MGRCMDARLLIVGGPSCIATSWIDELVEAGAVVDAVANGTDALRHLDLLQPDVVLIDVHLPGPLDGFDTCRAIRARNETLVVFTTSRPAPFDEVVALAVGGDHFFQSETPVPIVIARIRALLRRMRGQLHADASQQDQRTAHRAGPSRAATNGAPEEVERVAEGDLDIDVVAREVRVNGTVANLTRIEFDLLVTLARAPRRVFTREQLMASAWDHAFDGSHVLDSHLSRLRRKIDGAGGQRVAHSVRGVGYRLRG